MTTSLGGLNPKQTSFIFLEILGQESHKFNFFKFNNSKTKKRNPAYNYDEI